MVTRKKWVSFGVAGAVGLTIVGGAAAATAASMSLHTTDGSIVPGGPVVGPNGNVLDRPGLQLRVTDTSVSVVSAPSATPAPSVVPPVAPSPSLSQVSAVSAPSPVPPPAPAPVAPPPAPAPASAASIASVVSAWSD